MHIKCKGLWRTNLISYKWQLQIDQLKRSGRNLDELNECSWAGGSWKIMIPSSFPAILWNVNVKCVRNVNVKCVMSRKIPIEQ